MNGQVMYYSAVQSFVINCVSVFGLCKSLSVT